eukprot:1317606-Karenia_brevis.AAC.1
MVQEVHRDATYASLNLPTVEMGHQYVGSWGDDPDTGGLLTFWRVTLSPTSVDNVHVVHGRILRTQLNFNDGCALILYNIHNWGILSAELLRFYNMLKADVEIADRRPTEYVVYMAGDFNNLAPGEFVHSIDPLQQADTNRPPRAGLRPLVEDSDNGSSDDDQLSQSAGEGFHEIPLDVIQQTHPGRASGTNKKWREIFGLFRELMQSDST